MSVYMCKQSEAIEHEHHRPGWAHVSFSRSAAYAGGRVGRWWAGTTAAQQAFPMLASWTVRTRGTDFLNCTALRRIEQAGGLNDVNQFSFMNANQHNDRYSDRLTPSVYRLSLTTDNLTPSVRRGKNRKKYDTTTLEGCRLSSVAAWRRRRAHRRSTEIGEIGTCSPRDPVGIPTAAAYGSSGSGRRT